MNYSTLDQIKTIAQTYGISPQKSKGQHFLLDTDVVVSMVEIGSVTKKDVVLEIGPGLGILTEVLVDSAKAIYAVELDTEVLDFLRDKFAGVQHLNVVNQDILRVDTQSLIAGSYKVIANIPYNITSMILKKFLTSDHQPEQMVLMVQKEVAERVCAQPGSMSLLALSVQLYGEAAMVATVDNDSFWPAPKVDSALLHISNIHKAETVLGDLPEKHFWQVARIGFSAKRKLLANNLANGLRMQRDTFLNLFSELDISETARPQELSLQQWISLAKNIEVLRN